MKPDDTTRDGTKHADWLWWLRSARWPSLPSPRSRTGDGQRKRLARLTARQLRRAPGTSASWSRFLVAHAVWILVVTLAAVGAAYAFANHQTRVYRSTAVVNVEPAAASASSGNPPDMATEENLVGSQAVLASAARQLHVPPATLASGLSVNVPSTTTLLDIGCSGPVPAVAQQRAQAIAQAYVSYRSPRPAPARGRAPAPPSTAPTAVLVTPASLPTSPASPKFLIDVAAALIVGLALGIGTAALRDYTDDRPRGPVDLEAQAGAPVLALIPAFRVGRHDPGARLAVTACPDSVVAEAYRGLRTRVLQAAAPTSAKTLLVTSPGWEDTSTVTANLAAALAQTGRNVVLVSADLRWGRAHQLLRPGSCSGLSEVLEGQASLVTALHATDIPGLWLLPPGATPGDPGALLQRPVWPATFRDVRRRADFVVIEAPGVLAGPEALVLADVAEMILIVADARRSTRSQLRPALRELEPVRGKLAGCVLSNVGRRHRLRSRPPEPAADGRVPAEAGSGTELTPAYGQHHDGELEGVLTDLARAIAGRGGAYAAVGRPDQALTGFTRAIDLNGDLASAIGPAEEEPDDATRVIDLDTDLAQTIGRQGEVYAALGRHEEAQADFGRAIDLDPGDAWVIGSRARAYQAMGRLPEALAEFTRAIGLDPSLAWAVAGRGEVYAALGRHEEAQADFGRAKDLSPGLVVEAAGPSPQLADQQ